MTPLQEIEKLKAYIPEDVTLIAVSKTHTASVIREVYDGGHKVFGENRPQELKAKYDELPKDISWHMIGHLQTNKVKYIAPFVELIHSVDSDKLMSVIDKEAAKNDRIIDVLFEVHVALEETKIGWDAAELKEYVTTGIWKQYRNVRVRGLMTIASQTSDDDLIRAEFISMNRLFNEFKPIFGPQFDTLSMGMTSDFPIAIECGATMVRIGSLIFGQR